LGMRASSAALAGVKMIWNILVEGCWLVEG
jgi:hypothetical protein